MTQLDAQRPTAELQMPGELDQRAQRDALQRNRVAAAQRVDIDPVPKIGGDHGQAGETALSRLGLQNDRQPRARPEIEVILPHDQNPFAKSGSRTQFASERRSRITSALKSMPACSDILFPLASTSGRSSTAIAL